MRGLRDIDLVAGVLRGERLQLRLEDVRRAVGILEDRNWVKVVTDPAGPSGGRPSEKVWINPAVLGMEGKP